MNIYQRKQKTIAIVAIAAMTLLGFVYVAAKTKCKKVQSEKKREKNQKRVKKQKRQKV